TVRHRPLDAGLDLRPVEGLSRAASLHDHQRKLLEALVRGEAPAAREALAPAPDGGAVLGGARVDDLVVRGLAIRATHRPTVSSHVAAGAASPRAGKRVRMTTGHRAPRERPECIPASLRVLGRSCGRFASWSSVLDVRDSVESREFEHSAHFGCRRVDHKAGTEQLGGVVRVNDRACSRRVDERDEGQVEAELVALPVERLAGCALEDGSGGNIQLPSRTGCGSTRRRARRSSTGPDPRPTPFPAQRLNIRTTPRAKAQPTRPTKTPRLLPPAAARRNDSAAHAPVLSIPTRRETALRYSLSPSRASPKGGVGAFTAPLPLPGPGDHLAGHERRAAARGGERVDEGARVTARLEVRRDRPQRVARLHDIWGRGRAALGDCEG